MNSLLTELGKENPDMVVILAGYTAPMKRLLESNEGVESRFPNVFNFEDYTTNELLEIGKQMISRRYHFKRHRYYDSTNATLRPVLEVLKVLLYILITPLRVINAIYFDIIVHGLTELYDYLLEVFAPCNRKEGAGDVWIWLLTFPWRILKYPVFHGALALLESVIWTVIDTFIPAITLYHGTDLTAGQSITGEKRRNRRLGWGSGTFMASSSSWGGIGVYFAASRRLPL